MVPIKGLTLGVVVFLAEIVSIIVIIGKKVFSFLFVHFFLLINEANYGGFQEILSDFEDILVFLVDFIRIHVINGPFFEPVLWLSGLVIILLIIKVFLLRNFLETVLLAAAFLLAFEQILMIIDVVFYF